MHDFVNSCSNRAMFKLHCARTENTICSLLFGHTCDLETMSWLSQLEGFRQTKQLPPLNTCARWKGENGFIHDLVDVINKSWFPPKWSNIKICSLSLLSNEKGPPNPNLNSVPLFVCCHGGHHCHCTKFSIFRGNQLAFGNEIYNNTINNTKQKNLLDGSRGILCSQDIGTAKGISRSPSVRSPRVTVPVVILYHSIVTTMVYKCLDRVTSL